MSGLRVELNGVTARHPAATAQSNPAIDALTLSIDRFAAPRNPQCVCCGDTPSLTTLGMSLGRFLESCFYNTTATSRVPG
jgi:hypothetical protein